MLHRFKTLLLNLRRTRSKHLEYNDSHRIVAAAILHLDIVGSTRKVQQDILLAHQQLKQLHARIYCISQMRGGIARELRGDAIVVEFPSADSALAATLAMHAANALLDNSRLGRIYPQIRTGISYGQIISEGRIITGAPVIKAQRIEQCADPGKVEFDQGMFDQLKLDHNFEIQSLGERLLKGFDEPTRVYRASKYQTNLVEDMQTHWQSLKCEYALQ